MVVTKITFVFVVIAGDEGKKWEYEDEVHYHSF